MKDKIEVLKEAAGTAGEIVKIKYNGGSQPGSIREIMPRKVDIGKDMLYAYCIASDRIIGLRIAKIEIAGENDAINYVNLESQIDPKPATTDNFNKLKEYSKNELEKLGWLVKIGDNSIELNSSGKKRTTADIGIFYENDTWVVKNITSFHSESDAVKKFLKCCK